MFLDITSLISVLMSWEVGQSLLHLKLDLVGLLVAPVKESCSGYFQCGTDLV